MLALWNNVLPLLCYILTISVAYNGPKIMLTIILFILIFFSATAYQNILWKASLLAGTGNAAFMLANSGGLNWWLQTEYYGYIKASCRTWNWLNLLPKKLPDLWPINMSEFPDSDLGRVLSLQHDQSSQLVWWHISLSPRQCLVCF